MIGKILTAGFCFVVLIAIFAAIRRRQRQAPGPRVAAPAAGRSLFGLAPADAERFQDAAREQMQRDRTQWGRDYLPGVADSAPPGRIAGIPRTLRVRR